MHILVKKNLRFLNEIRGYVNSQKQTEQDHTVALAVET